MLAVTCTDECMSDNSPRPLDHRDKSRSQAEKEKKKKHHRVQTDGLPEHTDTHTLAPPLYDATISVSSARRLKYRTIL